MNDFVNKMLKYCWMLLFSIVLPCCDDSGDEEITGESKQFGYPLEFMLHVSEDINTDDWQELADKRIAVAVDEEVKEFSITSDGTLTSSESFYTNGRDSITVEAWYPYRKHKPYLPIVKPNQHLEADYEASNQLEMPPTFMSVSGISSRSNSQGLKLVLFRRTAKLECVLVKGEQTDESLDLETATISLLNMKGVEVGSTIHMSSQHRAYVFPQTLKAGAEFIRISLANREPFHYALPNDYILEAGKPYTLTITIGTNNGGIDVTITPSSTWDGSDETITGDAPALKDEGSNGENWNGGSTDTNGNSSATDPSGSNGDNWNGGSTDTNGSSSATDPSGSNGDNWNGGSTDTNGSSSATDPSGSNGDNWNGGSTDTNGSAPTTDPSGTNGENWNGNSSDVIGTGTSQSATNVKKNTTTIMKTITENQLKKNLLTSLKK